MSFKNILLKTKILFKKERSLIILILLIGLSFRLVNLWIEPYWGDELLSLDIVRYYEDDLGGMVNYLREVEVHPPLYYIFLKYWADIFGNTQGAVRSLSVIFGLGVIYVSYILFKKVFNNKNAGLLAAFFIAVLPIQIEYSQEARPYIIFTFFGLLSAYFLWCYLNTLVQNKRILLAGFYIVTSLVGFYLHYSFLFILIALSSFWFCYAIFWQKNNKFREFRIWLITHFIIFIGFFWQLQAMLYKAVLSEHNILGLPRTVGSMQRPLVFFDELIDKMIWLTRSSSVFPIEILAVLLFKFIFIFSIFYLFIYSTKFVDNIKNNKKGIIYVIWISVVPALFFLISPQSISYVPVFQSHVLIISIFLISIIAYIFTCFNSRKKFVLVILFLASITSFTLTIIQDKSNTESGFRIRHVAEFINESYEDGDLVLVDYAFVRTDVSHYLRDDIKVKSLFPTFLLEETQDELASRNTLGFIENESHSRMEGAIGPTWLRQARVDMKMDYLEKTYNPKKIWLVFFRAENYVDSWFSRNNWVKELGIVHPIYMPVQMYAKQLTINN